MRNLLKMKSLLLMVSALVAISLTSLALTACGDDDDYSNTITVNGKNFTVTGVEVKTIPFEISPENIVDVDLFAFLNGEIPLALIYIPKQFENKMLDLSKDYMLTSDVGLEMIIFDENGYGYDLYADSNRYEHFKSGKMKLTFKNGKLTIETKGIGVSGAGLLEKTPMKDELEAHPLTGEFPFEISYSGTTTEMIDE